MRIGIHAEYPIFLSSSNETRIFQQIFEKYSNIIFHEYPSVGSRITLRGRTDGQTDMMKLIVAFRNFANAPKNYDTGNKNTNLIHQHRLHELGGEHLKAHSHNLCRRLVDDSSTVL
jgi:hypothetical protein